MEGSLCKHLLDSLSLSGWRISGELSSVKILNPVVGNSLGEAIGQDSNSHE